MTNKINRPTDDYSPLWGAYWAQNPGVLRSVGADAVEGEGAAKEGEAAPAPKSAAETLFGGDASRDAKVEVAETPEQKTEREAAEAKAAEAKAAEDKKAAEANETAEQKAARETAEKAAADKTAADKLTADVKTFTDAGFKKADGESDADFVKRATAEKAEKDKSAAAEMRGAPEDYKVEDFKAPEGLTIDAEKLAKVKPLFRELDLSVKGAQKLVDYQAAQIAEASAAQQKAWDDLTTGWKKATQADKEVGGEALQENMAIAKETLKQFGTPELAEAAETYAWGNHPEFLRFLIRVGKAAADDKLRVGRSAGGAPKSAGEVMFKDMKV